MNRKAGVLTIKQLFVLLAGISLDFLGTAMMYTLSEEVKYDLHTISGYLAITLMITMAVYALFAVVKKNQSMLTNFGKYFLPILIVWTISYATGIVVGLQKVS